MATPAHVADTITCHDSKLTFSQKIGEDKLGHYAVSTFLIKKWNIWIYTVNSDLFRMNRFSSTKREYSLEHFTFSNIWNTKWVP